ncbi:MAG: hypothetical protein IKZ58_03350 [Selenomonadaceae bacterium]|nr:hypothetical protein [Selenomonadaceae bacterium]
MKNLVEIFKNAQTEEELKNSFAKFFNLKLDTKNFIDLYTPQILFEFKLDDNIKNLRVLSKCVAQSLYYIRRLKYGRDVRTPSNFICIVTKNFAFIEKTDIFSNFYFKSKAKNFDWDLAPSSPCQKLVDSLANFNSLKNSHVYDFYQPEDANNFIKKINQELSQQLSLFADKKIIDEFNFFEIFSFWQKLFGDFVENGKKSSEYFITDIEDGKSSLLDNRSVIFRMSSGETVEKFLPINDYEHFWSIYQKISSPREIISIRQKMDRMTEIDLRRRTGEFFTPINFAEKAVEYISRVVGENWYKSGNFRLWDMAAGTGNLEFALPAESLQYCYISTLLDDDANYCKKIFPDATVFQYDYLNDDVQFFYDDLFEKFFPRKMPKNLVDDLKNPNLKWIIFINPPYATANNNQDRNLFNKDNISMTKTRELMNAENLGEVSRELFSQFIYRISKEFFNRQTYLGIFSTPKYINSTNDQKFRDKIFQYKFERGFIFSSKNFDGCKGSFSVAFLVWNLHKKISLEEQKISLDVYNENVEKFAVKNISSENRKYFLSKWIKRPPAIKKFPPLSGGFNIAEKNKDRRDRISENFLASFMSKGNEFSNQTFTSLLSGPYVSAGAMSVTPENFEESMIIHAVRRIPKATWLNDRDQFMQPKKELTREFICDCVIWSLFAPSNATVSLRNVEYEGKIYRMKNNLFPFLIEELRTWEINSELNFSSQIFMKQDNRYAAIWIKNNFLDFSREAREVLSEGKNLYKIFYEGHFNLVELEKFKIYDWDVGWYQLRNIVKNFDEVFKIKIPFEKLGEKILPKIYELGFLRDEVKYF